MTSPDGNGRDSTPPTTAAAYPAPGATHGFTSATIGDDDRAVAEEWLNRPSDWQDSAVSVEFERSFAEWNGSTNAFAFMHGRVALSACLHALGLVPGDEVILPGFTCVAVPNALRFAGITPVYADIELDTYGLDVNRVEALITAKTKAILLHHLFGLVCRDYEAILRLAARHGLRTIEDCAHSMGAEYGGSKVGTRGDLAIYSTQRSKVISTIDGGLAVTNQAALADGLREYQAAAREPDSQTVELLLHHAVADSYRYRSSTGERSRDRTPPRRWSSISQEERAGRQPSDYHQKMPAPLAALGLNQLEKIDGLNAMRRENAQRWDAWCERQGLTRPTVVEGSIPVFLRYPVFVDPHVKARPERLADELGTCVGIWFATNIHPVDWEVKDCVNASRAVRECINLPTLRPWSEDGPEAPRASPLVSTRNNK